MFCETKDLTFLPFNHYPFFCKNCPVRVRGCRFSGKHLGRFSWIWRGMDMWKEPILLNIIIRCNIAGKLKITDLTSHLRPVRNCPSKTVILPLIAASILCQRKKPSSISPVSVRLHAQGSLLPSAFTRKAKTQEKSLKKWKCAQKWRLRVYAGKARHVYTLMVWVIYRRMGEPKEAV